MAALIAKDLFLKEVVKFKKEFTSGFRDLFGGPSIDNIIEYAKSSIEGLAIPIQNEITATSNMITGSEGLRDFIDSMNVRLIKIFDDFRNDPNVVLLLLGVNYFIGKFTDKLSDLLDDQIDMLDLWALWAETLPPPPTPSDTFVLPLPEEPLVWPDPYGWDPLDPWDRPWGDDDGGDYGWH